MRAVLGLTLLLGACAAVQPVERRALGPDPVISGGSYDSGGGVIVAVDLRESAGRTMVCGIWAEGAGQASLTLGPKSEVLASGSVYLGNRAVVRGLGFLREVPRAESYAGAPAGCVLTERPWRAEDAARRPVVRFPRKDLYLDAEDVGGDMVEFFPEPVTSGL